jgi:hypothetical protein
MTLGQAQREFALDIAHLIFHAYEMGYELSFGDAYRDPRVHGEYGVKGSYATAKSEHKRRLAVDLNLFKNGKYLSKTSDHKALGEYWESLNEKNVWGGRFKDGNHYQRDL